MQKMILNNGIELKVKTLIINYGGELTIEFEEGVTYEDVAPYYDPIMSKTYDEDNLRRFELYSENGGLDGVHLGYTITKNISCLNGVVKVLLEKESELRTEVKSLQKELLTLKTAMKKSGVRLE